MRDYHALYNKTNGDLGVAEAKIQKLEAKNKELDAENQELKRQVEMLSENQRIECLRSECVLLFQTVFSILPEEADEIFRQVNSVALGQWKNETIRRLMEHWLSSLKSRRIDFVLILLKIEAWFLMRVAAPIRFLKMTWKLRRTVDDYEIRQKALVDKECREKREEIEWERLQFEEDKASQIAQAVSAETRVLRDETQRLTKVVKVLAVLLVLTAIFLIFYLWTHS